MSTYARLPITFTRGEGVWLWDEHNTRYCDAISGIAVCNLGHAHPDITQALCQQAAQLVHTSNLYHVANQEALGDMLCAAADMDRAFFCNSGTEANEAAIKLARLHGHKKNITVPTIIVMENSFHGRTMAALTATGNEKIKEGFGSLIGNAGEYYVVAEMLKRGMIAALPGSAACAWRVGPPPAAPGSASPTSPPVHPPKGSRIPAAAPYAP
jgi:acetylornithine/succinyldiaminopimelate/putrescine aminotransferase